MKDKALELTEKWILPIILFFLPFYGFNRGIDLSDTMYSLSNYMFFEEMNSGWKYATYLANAFGAVCLRLCRNNMVLMSLLSELLFSFLIVGVYYIFRKTYSYKNVFIGCVLAICLNWGPALILYNSLTYVLLNTAVLVLYKALMGKNRKLLFVAGLLLGINLFVRISNVTQVALIVVVWYAGYRKKEEEESDAFFSDKHSFWKNTGCCVSGYVTGALLVFVFLVITEGTAGFVGMLDWIMSMFTSDSATGGYSAFSMFYTIADNYMGNFWWFFLLLLAGAAGVLGFNVFKGRFVVLKRIGYCACTVLLFVYFYRNGIFTSLYYNTGAIYRISVVFLWMTIAVLTIVISGKKFTDSDKLVAAFGLVIVFITPIGSNNHLFTNIANLYFVAPAVLVLLPKVVDMWPQKWERFPVKALFLMFFTIYMTQAVLFHMTYVFFDGENGEAHTMTIRVETPADGMYSNEEHVTAVTELVLFMREADVNHECCLYYGGIPGCSYLLEKPAVISTTWPDLESYSSVLFREELESVEDSFVIICSKKAFARIQDQNSYEGMLTEAMSEKDEIIRGYMEENSYVPVFENEEFVVLKPENVE